MNEESALKRSPWIAIALGGGLAFMAIWIALTITSAFREMGVKKSFSRGLDAFYLNDWDSSLQELRSCMQRKPAFAPPYEVAGYIHFMKGEVTEAEQVFADAVNNAGQTETPLSMMGLAVINAERTAEKRELSQLKLIAGQMESMQDLVPCDVDALINAAAIRLNAEDTSVGKRLLRTLKEKEAVYTASAMPVLANARGVLAYTEGNREEAMTQFRYAAGRAGSWGAPRANLSALSVDTVSSLKTADEVIEKLFPYLHSTNTSAFSRDDAYLYHNTLGVVAYMRLGEKYYGKAIEHFNKAITVKPDEPWAKLNKAAVMALHADRVGEKERVKHVEATEKVYHEVLAGKGVDNKIKYLMYNVLGILAMKRNAPDKALEWFEKAYEMKKDDYLVCTHLGILHYTLKHYARAKRYYKESGALKDDQEEVNRVLKVLTAVPTLEAASVRYTTDVKPVVGVRAGVNSCPATVENCRIEVKFDDTPGFFTVRPCYLTCVPAGDLLGGRHKLNITVTDPAGNKTERAFEFAVDRKPPRFHGVKPKAAGVAKGNNPTIVIRAWDELSAVDLKTVYVKYMTGEGMDMMVSEEVLRDGKYQYDMPALNIKKGQVLSTEEIKFVPKNSLVAGSYRLFAQGSDVVGNRLSPPAKWDFFVEVDK